MTYHHTATDDLHPVIAALAYAMLTRPHPRGRPRPPARPRRPTAADGRFEDYMWLRGQGCAPAIAAARIGISAHSARWRYENRYQQAKAAA